MRSAGFTDSDKHLSPLQPSHWQINRGDRQSFYITSMTIALYIFSQRNRLPGPSHNPHIHFLHILPLRVHSRSVQQPGISTAAAFVSLSPRQKQRDQNKVCILTQICHAIIGVIRLQNEAERQTQPAPSPSQGSVR